MGKARRREGTQFSKLVNFTYLLNEWTLFKWVIYAEGAIRVTLISKDFKAELLHKGKIISKFHQTFQSYKKNLKVTPSLFKKTFPITS